MSAAAIDDGGGADDGRAGSAGHSHRLACGASGRHDIFYDQDPFTGVQGEATAQRQHTVLTFRKDRADTQCPRHFVADDDAAERGRQHDRGLKLPNLGSQGRSAGFGLPRVLQDKGTLQVP